MASISASNNPENNFQSHTALLQAEHAAMYSASVVLSAIPVYCLLNQEIMPNPKLKQHHDVLFLYLALPPQSESAYPCNLISPLDVYLSP